jgi:putative ubiquitin-RnfH superfamily antitoxin RatB of RatAB toxin-antitoxin module
MPTVTLACSPAAREVFEETLVLPEGATVRDAVAQSGLAGALPAFDWSVFTPGIWGRAASWEQPLADGDRIELCRALSVDPKVARRERFRQQGARGTGLFARRRKGGKAGY